MAAGMTYRYAGAVIVGIVTSEKRNRRRNGKGCREKDNTY